MRRLGQAMATLSIQTLATVVLARIEQDGDDAARGLRRLRWTNVGHPAPVLLHADGSVEVLRTPPELLVGVRPDCPRTDLLVDRLTGQAHLLLEALIDR